MNDTTKEWERRFEAEAPLAYGGRDWAKNFIRETLDSQKQAVVEIIKNKRKSLIDMGEGYVSDEYDAKEALDDILNELHKIWMN